MDHAGRLREEARAAGERRLLVVTGDPDRTRTRAREALAVADIKHAAYVGAAEFPVATVISPDRTEKLLGTTYDAVVLDCHDACRPNAIGRAVGAVDGGGLFVLLTPPLGSWPTQRDEFDASLAVPPYEVGAVAGNFRRRLVATLRAHRGVAIVAPDGTVLDDGLTDPAPRRPQPEPSPPAEAAFPEWTYAACRTADQAEAVAALEGLRDAGNAVVVEADRGRGKSSAAGLAAAALATEGRDVLVTAPAARNVETLFARAREHLEIESSGDDRELAVPAGGRIRFEPPAAAATLPGEPDCVIVDEAAGVPVDILETLLGADAVAFTTTVHGYEGAGRGFAVRFRDRLAESPLTVTEVSMDEPIRYAPGDPIEVWSFRALALDARAPVDPLIAAATPETVEYRAPTGPDLLADEHLLRELFGLLVAAHYRTEPDDLARLLDAPNVTAHTLLHDGHVVAVALLAREGGLPAETRASLYAGGQVRGHLLPDVLTHQLRDEAATEPVGHRVLRIATHGAVRSRGLGSHLLAEIRERVDGDWFGAAFGATPGLCRFWRANGFRTVHLGTARNERSGERSALVLDPLTPAGEELCTRHTEWFHRRAPATFSDALADADPAVIGAACRGAAGTPPLCLSDQERRFLAGVPEGAAVYETAPRPVRRLVYRHVVDPAVTLDDRTERLLIYKTLQARSWAAAADRFDFDSTRTCKKALGAAVGELLDAYGGPEIDEERARLREIRE